MSRLRAALLLAALLLGACCPHWAAEPARGPLAATLAPLQVPHGNCRPIRESSLIRVDGRMRRAGLGWRVCVDGQVYAD